MLLFFIPVLINIIIYIYGFLPFNDYTTSNISPINLTEEHNFSPHFDKMILIVIDALRSDFVQDDTMPFTTTRARKEGCTIRVKVETPTVTLPRIKSMTTGTIPIFTDILFNLAGTKKLEDSILHSLHHVNKQIVFYGDDTWLSLFPDLFHRSEGTSSFYVSDFYEVDNNVTRNVKEELQRDDWDVMILHYLGLDHIGHVYGPSSPLVPVKLREMDEIIELIHTKTMSQDSNTLILITGDHGMKDSGGHGGSTFSETNVPLIMLGTLCEDDSISQTDIPVNLAALLGVKIPSASIGLVRRNMLKKFKLEQYLFTLKYNTMLLLMKRNICHDDYELAMSYHDAYMQNNDEINADKAIQLYENCSQRIQEHVIETSTKQDVNIMIAALANLCYIFLLVTNSFIHRKRVAVLHYFLDTIREPFPFVEGESVFLIISTFINFLYYLSGSFTIFILCMGVLIAFELGILFWACYIEYHRLFAMELEHVFIFTMSLLHPFMLLSSSFVEEEHQFWYFILTSLMFLCLIRNLNAKRKHQNLNNMLLWFSTLVLLRFSRSINQTGDKWSHLSDISDWFLTENNTVYLSLYFVICIFIIKILCISVLGRSLVSSILSGIIFLLILCNNFTEDKLILQRCVWVLIATQGVLLRYFYKTSSVVAWISICTLLLKPYNLGLITLCIISSKLFESFREIELQTLAHLSLGKALFFMQGHSNSFASIDISSGYVALSSYQPLIVIFQVLCHTYAMPVLSFSLLFRNKSHRRKEVWCILFLHQLLTVIVFFINTLINRHHLFIWSVFTPKMLIESCHTVILFIEWCIF